MKGARSRGSVQVFLQIYTHIPSFPDVWEMAYRNGYLYTWEKLPQCGDNAKKHKRHLKVQRGSKVVKVTVKICKKHSFSSPPRPLSVSIYFPCAWLAPFSYWESLEARFLRNRDMKGECGGAGGARKGKGIDFGNWSTASATLLFYAQGKLQTHEASLVIGVNGLLLTPVQHGLCVCVKSLHQLPSLRQSNSSFPPAGQSMLL